MKTPQNKIKVLALAIAAGLATSANATTFHNQGAVLGYGDAANNHTLFGNFKNPAFLGGDDTVRKWGLGASVGIDVEFKNVTEMDDNFEQMQDEIESLVPGAGSKAAAENAVNDFLGKHEDLSVNIKASGSIPLVVQTTNYGGYMLAASMTSGGSVSMVRNGDVSIDASGDWANLKLEGTNAGLAFNTFQMAEFSATYAFDLNRFFKPQNAQINAGVRAKLMTAAFNQYVFGFDDAINNRDDDFSEQISDGIDDTMDFSNTDSQLGLDFGIQYIAKNYLVGLTVENINSPTFNYTRSAHSAASFDSLVSDKIKFEPKARAEGAFYSQNRRWTLAAFADLNKTLDITGLETQKAGVAASYASTRWWMPNIRAGYTTESQGNKMNRVHGGITAGFLNIDVSANSFEFDENKETSLAANISVELAF